MFERTHCRFTADGREIFKKLIQSLPAFEIVQQGLERDACSPEYGRAPEDIRVPRNYAMVLSEHALQFTPSR